MEPERERRPERPLDEPGEVSTVPCDVCGRVVPREEALVDEVNDEFTYSCSEECRLRRESIEIDRGPGPEDRGL